MKVGSQRIGTWTRSASIHPLIVTRAGERSGFNLRMAYASCPGILTILGDGAADGLAFQSEIQC
jgi:hypothetical protein